MTRLCNKLALHGKVEEAAHKILKIVRRLRLTAGRGGKGVAAAATYLASTIVGERRTQRELAEAMDITEVTIRNRYKEMIDKLLITSTL